ncbi:MAG: DUF6341 family protein [Flavobacteriales bacterium]
MTWKGFFEGIQSFFVDFAFGPYDALRKIAPENWLLSNIVSWILFSVGIVLFIYWMMQLTKFKNNNDEDMSLTSHTFF